MEGVEEELVLGIFEQVLQPLMLSWGKWLQVLARGKLTPVVLKLFLDSEHDRVLQRVQQLNIQQVPHVLPLTRNLWLGDKPNWY